MLLSKLKKETINGKNGIQDNFLKHHLKKKENIHLLLNPFLCLLNLFHSFISEGWLQLQHWADYCSKGEQGGPSFLPVPFSPGLPLGTFCHTVQPTAALGLQALQSLIKLSPRTWLDFFFSPFGTAVTPRTLHFPFCLCVSNVVLSTETAWVYLQTLFKKDQSQGGQLLGWLV